MVQWSIYRWCSSDMEMVPIEGYRAEVWLYESATARSINPKTRLNAGFVEGGTECFIESQVKCQSLNVRISSVVALETGSKIVRQLGIHPARLQWYLQRHRSTLAFFITIALQNITKKKVRSAQISIVILIHTLNRLNSWHQKALIEKTDSVPPLTYLPANLHFGLHAST